MTEGLCVTLSVGTKGGMSLYSSLKEERRQEKKERKEGKMEAETSRR